MEKVSLCFCTELKELQLLKQLWQWEPTCILGAMQIFLVSEALPFALVTCTDYI